jgi:CRISPR/Cas system-associated exonuclease Cas4 (RecB family)
MSGFVDQIYLTASQIASLDRQLVALALLLVSSLVVLNKISLLVRRSRSDSGLQANSTAVSIDGSNSVPVRKYVSERLGLAGSPDALISEAGFIIPVERKPLARKIRDRYVAQLLVYMRLVEECEGKRPPYGYLILGPSCRKFKIENSPERQAWLQQIIDRMLAVHHGLPSKPTPHISKCRKCDVRHACKFNAELTQIQERKEPEKPAEPLVARR